MSDKPKVTAMDLLGIIPNPYSDIPSEMLTGLANGKLGDWLQEIADAGVSLHIDCGEVYISDGAGMWWGGDRDTRRVDVMLTRAYLAWRGREVSV